jgi:broad specificity phosphatase PhoE
LRATRVGAIFASDLSRASQTAAAIAQRHQVPVVTDRRLREFAFGQWEGLTWEQIIERFPHTTGADLLAVRDYRPPGGETLEDVRARVGAFLDGIPELDGDVVVVSHAGALHAALAHLFGDPYFGWNIRLLPASLTRIRRMAHAPPEATVVNDVAHLAATT